MNLIRIFVHALVFFHVSDVRFQWLSTKCNFVADIMSRQGLASIAFYPPAHGLHGLTQRYWVPDRALTNAARC